MESSSEADRFSLSGVRDKPYDEAYVGGCISCESFPKGVSDWTCRMHRITSNHLDAKGVLWGQLQKGSDSTMLTSFKPALV